MESLEQWKTRELQGGGGVTLDLVLLEVAMIGAGVCIPEGGAQGSQMDQITCIREEDREVLRLAA